MRVITFKVDENTLEELDRFCANSGLSRSSAIRIAIKKLISEGVEIKPKPKRVRKVELY
ncbi:MAG: CopG family transcriptional regulator [Dictyoglomus sp. NZ13-RE01]|nr:MAG: CopG family transcriptional regulator [Dictyoglomus sp. NZ13-RE01]